MANCFALSGWCILAVAVVRRHDWLRDHLAGFWWPVILCLQYAAIVILFFSQSEGGFDSLANVRQLFASDWALLAGWIHYLAFDLFIGSWIARETEARGMSRWWLVLFLPPTFLLGPVGLLLFATTCVSKKGFWFRGKRNSAG
jgi:hypothetical protein